MDFEKIYKESLKESDGRYEFVEKGHDGEEESYIAKTDIQLIEYVKDFMDTEGPTEFHVRKLKYGREFKWPAGYGDSHIGK